MNVVGYRDYAPFGDHMLDSGKLPIGTVVRKESIQLIKEFCCGPRMIYRIEYSERPVPQQFWPSVHRIKRDYFDALYTYDGIIEHATETYQYITAIKVAGGCDICHHH